MGDELVTESIDQAEASRLAVALRDQVDRDKNLDLFGFDKPQESVGAQRGTYSWRVGMRAELRKFREKLQKDGIGPLDILSRVMMIHFEAERYEQAAEVAEKMLPYLYPRINAIAMMPGSDGQQPGVIGGGVVRFTWGKPEELGT
jgi:hypothetical protein